MTESLITTGSFSGSLVLAALYLFIGLALGGIVYAVIRYPRFRRPQFHQIALPPWLAWSGFLVFLVFAWMAYDLVGTRFFSLRITPAALELHYQWPAATERVPRSQYREAVARRAGKMGAEIVVSTREASFTSGQLSRREAEAVIEAIAEWRDAEPRD